LIRFAEFVDLFRPQGFNGAAVGDDVLEVGGFDLVGFKRMSIAGASAPPKS
jgi:hypothetical protein